MPAQRTATIYVQRPNDTRISGVRDSAQRLSCACKHARPRIPCGRLLGRARARLKQFDHRSALVRPDAHRDALSSPAYDHTTCLTSLVEYLLVRMALTSVHRYPVAIRILDLCKYE